MFRNWRHCGIGLFLCTLSVIAEDKQLSYSSSPQYSHVPQSRRNMGTDYQMQTNDKYVTNVTTQIGKDAFLPCKVLVLTSSVFVPLKYWPQLSSKGTTLAQQVGVLDSGTRWPHTHRGPTDVHRRRSVPGILCGPHRRMDAADQIR